MTYLNILRYLFASAENTGMAWIWTSSEGGVNIMLIEDFLIARAGKASSLFWAHLDNCSALSIFFEETNFLREILLSACRGEIF